MVLTCEYVSVEVCLSVKIGSCFDTSVQGSNNQDKKPDRSMALCALERFPGSPSPQSKMLITWSPQRKSSLSVSWKMLIMTTWGRQGDCHSSSQRLWWRSSRRHRKRRGYAFVDSTKIDVRMQHRRLRCSNYNQLLKRTYGSLTWWITLAENGCIWRCISAMVGHQSLSLCLSVSLCLCLSLSLSLSLSLTHSPF